jgi:hypothetical protein
MTTSDPDGRAGSPGDGPASRPVGPDEPDELDEDQDEFDDEDAGSPARAH